MFEEQTIKPEKLPFDEGDIRESKKNIEQNLIKASEEVDQKSFKSLYDYVRIDDLCSGGKLSCPLPLHVRNVTIEDLLALSEEDPIGQMKSVIQVLENISKEGIDATQLTKEEIIQIFLTLYANFHSPEIEFPYEIDEEEESILQERNPSILEAYKKGDHNWTISLPINKLKFKDLPKNFKEPITIKDETGFEFSFRIPRFGDTIKVQQAIKTSYTKLENELYPLTKKLEEEERTGKINPHITLEEREKYDNYLKSKGKDYVKYMLALQLIKVGSKTLTTIEDKIKAVNKIPIYLWKVFNDTTNEKLSFGIIEDNEVVSPITGKKVTRRLAFRPMDILQNFTKKRNNEVTIDFG